jgi:hypothetical protein
LENLMKTSSRILYLFLLAILMTACGGRPEAEPTTDIDAVMTAGVGTMVASFFETQTALYTPPVDTSTPEPSPTNTATVAPSLAPTLVSSPTQIIYFTATLGTGTPSLTPTITGTLDPASLASGCHNLALVSDLPISAGTILKPGQEFLKEWKVANTGTCAWKFAYRPVFVSGDQLSGVGLRVVNLIEPGKWTTLSAKMKAPDKNGTYTGYWRLSDSDGKLFGATLAVSIKVGTPPEDTSTPVPATATSTDTATPTEDTGTTGTTP